MDFKSSPVRELLEGTMRALLRDLNDASDPSDKKHFAGAIADIQKAIKDGLSQGGGASDALAALAAAELDKPQPTHQEPQ